MKNKTKKILAGACLGLVGMGCLTGCNAEDLKIPTDYNVTIPTDYNVTTTITGEKQYRLTVINDSEHGTIYPDLNNETSSVMVEEGDSYTFTIRAKEGYKLDNLLIDGELVEAQEIYTFSNIDKDHSIGAVYSEIIDKRNYITTLSLQGMIYDLYSTVEKQEIETHDHYLYISYSTSDTSSSSTSHNGQSRVGKNQASPFTNSIRFNPAKNIVENTNNVYDYYFKFEVENKEMSFTININKLELEYVENDQIENIYMLKIDNTFDLKHSSTETDFYKLTNLVLYFTAEY